MHLPILFVIMYVIFLGNLFLHGLIIWKDPVQQAAAVLMGLMILIMTVQIFRRGELRSRAARGCGSRYQQA